MSPTAARADNKKRASLALYEGGSFSFNKRRAAVALTPDQILKGRRSGIHCSFTQFFFDTQ